MTDEKQLEKNKSRLYTCLHIICESPQMFSQWLHLERQICQKKVDLIFTGLSPRTGNVMSTLTDLLASDERSSKQAHQGKVQSSSSSLFEDQSDQIWSCNYSDVDAMRPPSCAESFVLMIKGMIILIKKIICPL